jgi:hypothetical protein
VRRLPAAVALHGCTLEVSTDVSRACGCGGACGDLQRVIRALAVFRLYRQFAAATLLEEVDGR